MRKTFAATVAGALLFAAAVSAYCQTQGAGDFPNKRIIIYAVGPGGITDIAARQVAQGLSQELGQPVVVDNRSAGGEFSNSSGPVGEVRMTCDDTGALQPADQ